jgi:hypothetical protein
VKPKSNRAIVIRQGPTIEPDQDDDEVYKGGRQQQERRQGQRQFVQNQQQEHILAQMFFTSADLAASLPHPAAAAAGGPASALISRPSPRELSEILRRGKARSKIERFFSPFLHAMKCVEQRVKLVNSPRAAISDRESLIWAVFQMYGKSTDGLLVKTIR